MAMDVLIGGDNLDAANNIKTALPLTPAYMGGVRAFSENDPGTVTGTPSLKSPETSLDFRQRVGMDTILFSETFNATAQNISNWTYTFTTMTATQSAGFLNINAAGTSTVSGNCSRLQTWRYFALLGTAPISVEFVAQFDRTPIANEVFHMGLGVAVSAAEPVDGCYFEYTSAGLYGALRYNSGVATKVLLDAAPQTVNTNKKFVIVVGKRDVEFWVDDILCGVLHPPAAQGSPYLCAALPVFIQKYNNGVVGSSPNMIAKVADVVVTLMDIASSMSWANQMASCGLGSQQLNGGTAGHPQIQWANAALPTAAAATNTTAALGAFLGGLFQMNAPAAGTTDLIVSSYLNPLGSVNQTPRTIKLRGIKIDCINLGAAVATTPTTFAVAVAWGGNTLSLASTESASFATATTKGRRIQPLGVISFPLAAAIGDVSDTLQFDFEAPLVINPGEYIQVVAKPIVGTATASEVFQWIISPNLYHE